PLGSAIDYGPLCLQNPLKEKKDSPMPSSTGSGPFVKKVFGEQVHICSFKNREVGCLMWNIQSLICLPPKRPPILHLQIILLAMNLTASHHLFTGAFIMRSIAEYLFPCNQLRTIGWVEGAPMRNSITGPHGSCPIT